jgi:STE24 endopeptidase
MNDDEVVAVLGHELGHWKLSHTISNLLIAEVNLFFVLIVFSYFYKQPAVYQAFGFDSQPIVIGFLLIMHYILAPYNELVSLVMSFLSRWMEFSADKCKVLDLIIMTI